VLRFFLIVDVSDPVRQLDFELINGTTTALDCNTGCNITNAVRPNIHDTGIGSVCRDGDASDFLLVEVLTTAQTFFTVMISITNIIHFHPPGEHHHHHDHHH
jgi:hypothetical protein